MEIRSTWCRVVCCKYGWVFYRTYLYNNQNTGELESPPPCGAHRDVQTNLLPWKTNCRAERSISTQLPVISSIKICLSSVYTCITACYLQPVWWLCWSSSHFIIKQGSIQRPTHHFNWQGTTSMNTTFSRTHIVSRSFVGLLSQFIFSLYLVLLFPTSFHKFWSPKFCTLTSRYLLWRTQPVILWPFLAEFSFCIPWYVCSTQ